MATAAKPDNELTPELKAFIDGAIVPALVKTWLAENRGQDSLAPVRGDMDNAVGSLSAEQGVTT